MRARPVHVLLIIAGHSHRNRHCIKIAYLCRWFPRISLATYHLIYNLIV